MKAINYFEEYYKETKERLTKTIGEFNETLKSDNSIINYNLDLFKKLNSDGKLIRGTLVNLGYSLLEDDSKYSDKLALAYELFQTGILVHDDIIDKDDKRRGKDTVHHANYEKYHEYSNRKAELTHLSNSIGICVGTYGMFLANKVISENYADDQNLGRVLNAFNDIVLKTTEGELLDVVLPFESKNMKLDSKTLEENIMNIYRLKTAYYTIIGPLMNGLILAGADEAKLKEIKEFGEKVGIAFQIQDDILGIYSDQTGKVKGSDIREYKQTILYSYISNTEYKDELKRYYGKEELTEEAIQKVKDIFDISGAKNYANRLMNSMYDEGITILDKITWIPEDKKNILRGFVDYLRIRNK